MTDPLRPLNLVTALTTLEAVLDVCCAIPGTAPRNMGVPWAFPEVGRNGQALGADTHQNTGAKITYDVISIVGLGNDEQRAVYDPDIEIEGDTYVDPENPGQPLGGVVISVSGNRLITVQVKCEVHGAGSSMAGGAHVYLERCRTRLGLPTVSETLNGVGLAINDIRDTRPADFFDSNGRLVRCAYFELVLNGADCATDDPQTTIETTEIEEDPAVDG